MALLPFRLYISRLLDKKRSVLTSSYQMGETVLVIEEGLN